uniref:Echinoidin-like n=1 Tax=Saccoglossus kowalevskii TaxID=10224 RepID=A0ABM0LZM7_SACKO|nr:PREDICTED: echinoidin-like [Saccoglossus kowalevskii]
MVTSQEIQNLLKTYIYDNNIQVGLKGFWIGLNDRSREGVYRWPDGTRLRSGDFSSWARSQPNNNRRRSYRGQDCTLMWRSKGLNWADDYCGDYYPRNRNSLGYICEFNAC